MKIGWELVGQFAATPITAQGLSKSRNSAAKILEKAQQVEFVVSELRVSGDQAIVSVQL